MIVPTNPVDPVGALEKSGSSALNIERILLASKVLFGQALISERIKMAGSHKQTDPIKIKGCALILMIKPLLSRIRLSFAFTARILWRIGIIRKNSVFSCRWFSAKEFWSEIWRGLQRIKRNVKGGIFPDNKIVKQKESHMGDGNSIINLGDLAKPATVLIKKFLMRLEFYMSLEGLEKRRRQKRRLKK